MVDLDRNVLSRLEDKILENQSLRIHKTLPDFEIWYLIRREG